MLHYYCLSIYVDLIIKIYLGNYNLIGSCFFFIINFNKNVTFINNVIVLTLTLFNFFMIELNLIYVYLIYFKINFFFSYFKSSRCIVICIKIKNY